MKKLLMIISLLLFGLQLFAQWTGTDCESFKFGIVTDVQYCPCPTSGTKFYANSPSKLSICFDSLNTKNLEFIVHLGDVVDRDFVNFDVILPVFARATVPLYHVLGNHEYQNMNCEQQPLVHTKLGMNSKYYDFTIKKWRFIVLNSTDLHKNAYCGGSKMFLRSDSLLKKVQNEMKYCAFSWNGGISSEQKLWLKQQLDLAVTNNEKVVVFSHMPIYPQTFGNLWNDTEILDIIDGYTNIVAYVCGHNHEGGYAIRNNVHYFIHKGMVETESTGTYSWVEVKANQLVIHGYGNETDRILSYDNSFCPTTNIVNKPMEIDVYPNPTYDKIYIKNNENLNFEIALYNSFGAIVSKYTNEKNISLKHLNQGLYFLSIKTKEGILFRKIVKLNI